MECLFCKIINKTINSNILFEDEDLLVFDDINPQAPHHKLIIPRQHIATVNDLEVGQENLVGKMVLKAREIAQSLNIAENGYRLVLNCNAQGGQEIYHIHLHLLAGRQMHWPPG